MSELRRLRERGKTPPAVCPCCVQAFVMLPVARELTACSFEEAHQMNSVPLAFPLPYTLTPFSSLQLIARSLPTAILSLLCFCVIPLIYTSKLHCNFVSILYSFHFVFYSGTCSQCSGIFLQTAIHNCSASKLQLYMLSGVLDIQ